VTAQELLDALRRHWRIPFVALVVGAIAIVGVLVTTKAPAPRYQSAAHLSIADGDIGLPLALRGSIGRQAQVATRPDVVADAKKRAGVPSDTLATVTSSVTSTESGNNVTTTMNIIVETPSKELGPVLANSAAEAFIEFRRQAQLPELERRQAALLVQIAQVEERFNQLPPGPPPVDTRSGETPPPQDLESTQRVALQKTLDNMRTAYGGLVALQASADGGAGLLNIDDPTTLTAGNGAAGPVTLLAGLALLLGLGGAALAATLDTSLHGAGDAATVLGAPILGRVPGRPHSRRNGAPVILHSGSDRAAFRALAGTLKASGAATRRLLITSPTYCEDLPAVGANLAAGLAQLGLGVVLVGTDPDQVWAFRGLGLEDTIGYGELVGEIGTVELNGRLRRSLQRVPELPNLWILGPGAQKGPTRVHAVNRLLSSIEEENLGIDVTVVLGPPLLEAPDAPILANEVGSVLWALDINDTSRDEAEEAARQLGLTQATAVGVAVVSSKRSKTDPDRSASSQRGPRHRRSDGRRRPVLSGGPPAGA
jgi:capsular polysaccharide biosynthesis protein